MKNIHHELLICVIVLFCISFLSCNDQTLTVVNLPCANYKTIPFQSLNLSVSTDSLSKTIIYVDNSGAVSGDGIKVWQNGRTRVVSLSGLVTPPCMQFDIQVIRTDSAENSKLKFTGTLTTGIDTGGIYYCDNLNNNCDYIKIGYFQSNYGSNGWSGEFHSPMFNAYFLVDVASYSRFGGKKDE